MLFCFFEPFFFFAVFFLLAALHNGIAVAKCSASRNLLSTVGAKTYNTVIEELVMKGYSDLTQFESEQDE